MDKPSVVHNTFVIERHYSRSPARVFDAFADTAKKRRWFAESENHDVEDFQMDFRVGGRERAQYRFKDGTPFKGVILVHDAAFQDIVPNQRVVTAATMSFAGRCISAALVTFEFLPNPTGTDLICTHQAVFFEGADGPQIREAGMRKLLEQLAKALAS